VTHGFSETLTKKAGIDHRIAAMLDEHGWAPLHPDPPFLPTVPCKAIPDYDELFGPAIDEPRVAGK
jgi:hypothetical protein